MLNGKVSDGGGQRALAPVNACRPAAIRCTEKFGSSESMIARAAKEEELLWFSIAIDCEVCPLPFLNDERVIDQLGASTLALNHFMTRLICAEYLAQAFPGHGSRSRESRM